MRGAFAAVVAAVTMAVCATPAFAISGESGRTINATAGQAFSDVVATFNSYAQNATATIDWGDATVADSVALTPRSQNPDQSYSYGVTGSHTYAQPGNYQLKVTISAPNDPQDPKTVTTYGSANVLAPSGQQPPATNPQPQNQPPVALLSTETTTPHAGARMAVDASHSSDPDGTIISYAFDLDGNGSYETDCGNSPSAVASYGSKGTVRIGVLVTDSAGATSATTATVAVIGTPPKKGGKGSAPSGITLGMCRPAESVGRPGIDLIGSCLRTVATHIAEAVANSCFDETDTDPAGATRSALPLSPKVAIQQHYYTASGRIKLNGVDIKPNGGARLVIHKEEAHLYTIGGKASVSLNAGVLGLPAIPLANGKLDWKFPLKGGRLRIADFNAAPAANLFGFNIDGTAAVDLTAGGTGGPRAEVPVHIGLPGVFTDPTTGKGLTADITLKADNARKLYLDSLRVDLPHAFLGGLEINNLFFEYHSEESVWRGGAELILPSGQKLDALPPPSTQGVGFRNGGLEYAGADLIFPDPGVPVFSSVYLHKIGFTIETHPTRFTGTVQLTAGSAAGHTLASIDGAVFIVFANPDEPFDVLGVKSDTLNVLVSGKLTMLDTVPLAEAHVLYRYPYYIEAGGHFEYQIIKDRLFATATAGGWVDLGSGQFNIEAGADLCIDIKVYSGCKGGSVVLSSRGMGGCVSTIIADVGGGIYWSGGGKLFFRSCDIGPFRATLSRAAANGSFDVPVDRSKPFQALEVVGNGGPPNVNIDGPHGEHYTTPDNGFLDSPNVMIWRGSGGDKSTWVLIPNHDPGAWKVSPALGSQIGSVHQAAGLPQAKVSARLSGKGFRRVLSYKVKPLPGQTVQFVERGAQTAHVIGTARGTRGRIPFTLGAGPAGKRTIVAVVLNEGTVRKQLTVAQLRAPKPALPARPGRVHVRRKRSGLLVTWKRLPGVTRYVVGADLTDGRRVALVSRKPTLRIPAVPGTVGARVRVAGLTVTNAAGKRATVRVRPQKRLKR